MNNANPTGRLAPLLREHPALILSVIYVAASTIGMVYSWDLLRQFGINVFHYAQIGDFLLASLKEPFTWLLVVLPIFFVMLDNASSRRHQRKGKLKWLRWYGTEAYRNVNYLVLISLIVLFLHVYAIGQAEKIRAGAGKVVEVLLADESPERSATLLGTTGQFIFLFDPATRRVDIHPNENVQTISFLAPAGETEASADQRGQPDADEGGDGVAEQAHQDPGRD